MKTKANFRALLGGSVGVLLALGILRFDRRFCVMNAKTPSFGFGSRV